MFQNMTFISRFFKMDTSDHHRNAKVCRFFAFSIFAMVTLCLYVLLCFWHGRLFAFYAMRLCFCQVTLRSLRALDKNAHCEMLRLRRPCLQPCAKGCACRRPHALRAHGDLERVLAIAFVFAPLSVMLR